MRHRNHRLICYPLNTWCYAPAVCVLRDASIREHTTGAQREREMTSQGFCLPSIHKWRRAVCIGCMQMRTAFFPAIFPPFSLSFWACNKKKKVGVGLIKTSQPCTQIIKGCCIRKVLRQLHRRDTAGEIGISFLCVCP